MSRKIAVLALSVLPLLLASKDPVPPRQPATAAQGTASTPSATFGPVESLTATINVVDVANKAIFVKAPDGVCYSFTVRPSTRIMVGGQRMNITDLAAHVNQTASVTFVPTRSGNIAHSIDIAR